MARVHSNNNGQHGHTRPNQRKTLWPLNTLLIGRIAIMVWGLLELFNWNWMRSPPPSSIHQTSIILFGQYYWRDYDRATLSPLDGIK